MGRRPQRGTHVAHGAPGTARGSRVASVSMTATMLASTWTRPSAASRHGRMTSTSVQSLITLTTLVPRVSA